MGHIAPQWFPTRTVGLLNSSHSRSLVVLIYQPAAYPVAQLRSKITVHGNPLYLVLIALSVNFPTRNRSDTSNITSAPLSLDTNDRVARLRRHLGIDRRRQRTLDGRLRGSTTRHRDTRLDQLRRRGRQLGLRLGRTLTTDPISQLLASRRR